jgi:homoserine dehydrogenase
MRQVNIIVSGLGNIGSRFIGVLERKQDVLRQQYGLDIRLVGAVDVEGAAFDQNGLDLAQVAVLERRKSVATLPDVGHTGMSTLEILDRVQADVFFEATRVNLDNGEPGMSAMRAAIQHGLHLITTNKGPLALDYAGFRELARQKGVQIRHDGTVFGGLPAITIAERDLAGAVITRLEAQANLANSYILAKMSEGMSYKDAVQGAKDVGAADEDETLDVDGWDAVIKLVIFANAVLGMNAKIADVRRESMRDIDPSRIADAKRRGSVLKYIAEAVRLEDGRYDLATGLRELPHDHALASLGAQHMGVSYTSDLFGTITASIFESSPLPSASTMLRDLLILYQCPQGA